MKGIINKGIQELVETRFGIKAWERVKSLAGCDEPFFAIGLDYPDEMTSNLVKAASTVSGLDLETVMVEFGKFVVPNTLKDNYSSYFGLSGSTSREFLQNVNRIHDLVTRSISNAYPPRFEYERTEDERLSFHYISDRALCPVVKGLILGVGACFNEELRVTETACQHRGDPHCVFEVGFP